MRKHANPLYLERHLLKSQERKTAQAKAIELCQKAITG